MAGTFASTTILDRTLQVAHLLPGEVEAVTRVINDVMQTAWLRSVEGMDFDSWSSLVPDAVLDVLIALLAPVADSLGSRPHSGVELASVINIFLNLHEHLRPA
ncbi:hypothetical protein [Streptomyces spiramyceticus]|uniref:hypothetical protein n=1 Tax=Streptomyces spiramyceticus TaxID=299717 RepID=UPI00237AAA02|nr:hypothetical protein [Streptomyces spiramyceticus]